jgi:anaerobic magnesium-protoporphyrin IX monomethyl ester cyclase
MKVLLVNPPYPFEESPAPPLGIISLAAYLEKQGMDVRVEDYIIQPYSRERVRAVLNDYRPDVVGSTAVTMNVKKGLRILQDYKEEAPGVVTVMGGPHVSFDADDILIKNGYVDYVVRGEGEITFTEMLRALDSGSPVDGIAGVSCRRGGAVHHAEDRPLIEDINILPYPARHLVPLSKYRALSFPISMVTSRGCPYKCIFCVGAKMVGRKVRYFDVDRVVDEFEVLSKLGFAQINIADDFFTANRSRCMKICDEIIRRGIHHRWGAFARVDSVTEELLVRLKESGCYMLCFGIESGDQEILDRIKKRTTLEKCRRASELCHKVGVEPMMSFILGLPGETPESVEKTLEFGKSLSKNYGFHVLSPFPGTEVREKAAEYGITILTDDWDLYDANHAVSHPASMTAEEVEGVANEFNGLIIDYINDLEPRKKRGEALSEGDEKMLQGIKNFTFSKQLIYDGLVESYPGVQNGGSEEAIRGDFVRYVAGLGSFSRDEVHAAVERLFSLKCLTLHKSGERTGIAWSAT